MSDDFSEKYWERHYQGAGGTNGHEWVSPYLVSVAEDLAPGLAVDAGCGNGADAIWLAQQGWRVTAVDISATALEQSRHAAKAKGVTVGFQQADLTVWQPQANTYDLVTSHYVHTTDNQRFITKLANAVKPGGTLLFVGHQPPAEREEDHHAHGSHITADEIAAELRAAEWDIDVAESRTSERTTPNGKKVVLSDSVLVARKRQ